MIVCDDCGLDLSLTEFQLEAVRRRGNPVRRPACPARSNGAHRVSLEQLERVNADPRERAKALAAALANAHAALAEIALAYEQEDDCEGDCAALAMYDMAVRALASGSAAEGDA